VLNAIFNREGWLWITWGFDALPVGFILIAIGLLREGVIPWWQGYCIILGPGLPLNPDIETISTAGAVLMCADFAPIGFRVLSGRPTAGAAEQRRRRGRCSSFGRRGSWAECPPQEEDGAGADPADLQAWDGAL
jgi:hypothetical protein